MRWQILLYFAISNYEDVCARRSREMDVYSLIATKEEFPLSILFNFDNNIQRRQSRSDEPDENEEQDENVTKEASEDVDPSPDNTLPADEPSPNNKDQLVYGSLDNLGIRYGNTSQRVMYSDFRRNTVLEKLLRILSQTSEYSRQARPKVRGIKLRNSRHHKPKETWRKVMKLDNLLEFAPSIHLTSDNNIHRRQSRSDEPDDNEEADENVTKENEVSQDVDPSVDNTDPADAVYPNNKDQLVYGSLDNLGIRYGNTSQRVMYSDFRRNTALENLLRLLSPTLEYSQQARPKIIEIKLLNSKYHEPKETWRKVKRPDDTQEFPPSIRLTLDNNVHRRQSRSDGPDDNEEVDENVTKENEVSQDVDPSLDKTDPADAVYENNKDQLVYGSLDNLSIRYGNTSQRVMYSDFRRNSVLGNLLRLLNSRYTRQQLQNIKPNDASINQREESSSEFGYSRHVRRSSCQKLSSKDCQSAEESSDDEFNPQNPFTVHKNRYLKNFLWNHKMTGDHMNINPYANLIKGNGATAPELMLSRKWWYFNQDDYIPFR